MFSKTPELRPLSIIGHLALDLKVAAIRGWTVSCWLRVTEPIFDTIVSKIRIAAGGG